jgi:hypothetical protein
MFAWLARTYRQKHRQLLLVLVVGWVTFGVLLLACLGLYLQRYSEGVAREEIFNRHEINTGHLPFLRLDSSIDSLTSYCGSRGGDKGSTIIFNCDKNRLADSVTAFVEWLDPSDARNQPYVYRSMTTLGPTNCSSPDCTLALQMSPLLPNPLAAGEYVYHRPEYVPAIVRVSEALVDSDGIVFTTHAVYACDEYRECGQQYSNSTHTV